MVLLFEAKSASVRRDNNLETSQIGRKYLA
jgi:hypothetical protein